MIVKLKVTTRRVIAAVALAAGVVAGGALLVAYSGVYSVAASAGHPGWLDGFLALGMRRSVQVNSSSVKQPELGPPEWHLPVAAAHFHTGCAVCHGHPGAGVNPVFDHMLPSPPTLEDKARRWQRRELFWIVNHGLQYAGMPAWSGTGREDEVWSMALFLEALPDMTEQQYLTLANGNRQSQSKLTGQFVVDESPLQDVLNEQCDRCHDTALLPPTSPLIPALAGQRYGYLYRSLVEYQQNLRQSGVMEPVLNRMDDGLFRELARHYSGLEATSAQQAPAEFDAALGQALARDGDKIRKIPPCMDCHGPKARSDYPLLHGQSAAYLEQQLELYQRGLRNTSAQARLMTHAVQKLNADDIAAVAGWFASRQPLQPARAMEVRDD